MNKGLFRKGIVIGIILLFVGAGVIPSTVGIQKEKKSITVISSPGYIQDLIDNASDGDTIYIPSGIYYENVIVDKSINLIGENKDETIIDGGGIGDVVHISADWVNISGFTIQNSSYWDYAGIKIYSNHTTITGNNIWNNENGISLKSSSDNIIITGNNISNDGIGICLSHSSVNNIIGNNIISNRDVGMFLQGSISNSIIGNNISNNGWDGLSLKSSSDNNIITGNNISLNINNGIFLWSSSGNNTITGNNISKNDRGINIYGDCDSNTVYHNNFINNTENAFDYGDNTWDDGKYGNYWSDYKEKYPDAKKQPFKGIWDTPYDIEGGDNKDNCPLIKQWGKPRTRTITRTRPTSYLWFEWLLECFPLLERLLNLIR